MRLMYCRVYHHRMGVVAPDGRAWKTIPLAERIEMQTDKSGGPDACWPWTGTKNRKGYGVVGVAGKRSTVTRIIAKTPAHLCALHRCDNPSCCNPAHLYNGTRSDNNNDMYARGRDNRALGEAHGMAKLTTAAVHEIRLLSSQGEKQRIIALRFGVTQGTVSRAISGDKWGHV